MMNVKQIFDCNFFLILSMNIICVGISGDINACRNKDKIFFNLSVVEFDVFSLMGAILGISTCIYFKNYALIGVFVISFAYLASLTIHQKKEQKKRTNDENTEK